MTKEQMSNGDPPGSSLAGIRINLQDFNTALRPGFKGNLQDNKGNLQEENPELRINQKPNPVSDSLFRYQPLTTLYYPLSNIQANDLTYEIFLELINKTDYLLRTLVESLEKKLRDDQKGYRIEQERIKEKFR